LTGLRLQKLPLKYCAKKVNKLTNQITVLYSVPDDDSDFTNYRHSLIRVDAELTGAFRKMPFINKKKLFIFLIQVHFLKVKKRFFITERRFGTICSYARLHKAVK
jgi:hypothetical protein